MKTSDVLWGQHSYVHASNTKLYIDLKVNNNEKLIKFKRCLFDNAYYTKLNEYSNGDHIQYTCCAWIFFTLGCIMYKVLNNNKNLSQIYIY